MSWVKLERESTYNYKNAIINEIKEGYLTVPKMEYFKEFKGDGLHINTSIGDIYLVIDSGQFCCEKLEYKFFDTPDDVSKFIGAKILNITSRDILCDPEDRRETQLRIETDKGVLQYAIYNEHNGYYDHAVVRQLFGNHGREEFRL